MNIQQHFGSDLTLHSLGPKVIEERKRGKPSSSGALSVASLNTEVASLNRVSVSRDRRTVALVVGTVSRVDVYKRHRINPKFYMPVSVPIVNGISNFSMALSADGSFLAMQDGANLQIIDVHSNPAKTLMSVLTGPSTVLDFSPDGSNIVLKDNTTPTQLKIVKIDGGRLSDEFVVKDLAGGITCACYSPDNRFLAVGLDKAPWAVIYYRSNNSYNETSSTLPFVTGITCFAFTGDSQYLACGSTTTANITLLKVDNSRYGAFYLASTANIDVTRDLDFTPDTQWLVSTAHRASSAPTYTVARVGPALRYRSVLTSSAGSLKISADTDSRSITVFHNNHFLLGCTTLNLAGQSETFAIEGHARTIGDIEVVTAEKVNVKMLGYDPTSMTNIGTISGLTARTDDVKFIDANYLVTANGGSTTLNLLKILGNSPYIGIVGSYTLDAKWRLAVSKDGRTIAYTASTAVFFATKSGEALVAQGSIEGSSQPLGVSFSPDGNLVAIAWAGNRVTLHARTNGSAWSEVSAMNTGTNPPVAIEYFDTGLNIAYATYNTVVLLKVRGSELYLANSLTLTATDQVAGGEPNIKDLAVSPDGKYIVASSARTPYVHLLRRTESVGNETLTQVSTYVHSQATYRSSFTPDGRFLLITTVGGAHSLIVLRRQGDALSLMYTHKVGTGTLAIGALGGAVMYGNNFAIGLDSSPYFQLASGPGAIGSITRLIEYNGGSYIQVDDNFLA